MAYPKKSSENKEIAQRKIVRVEGTRSIYFLNQVINVINQTPFHQVQIGK